MGAPIRFALGDERGARRDWEEVLALGSGPDRERARVGLACLALRTALRSADEQDRLFAIEVALHELDFVSQDSPLWAYRLVQEAVARLLLGDDDAVDATLLELSGLSSSTAVQAHRLLGSVRSGEQPLSVTLDELLLREEPDEG